MTKVEKQMTILKKIINQLKYLSQSYKYRESYIKIIYPRESSTFLYQRQSFIFQPEFSDPANMKGNKRALWYKQLYIYIFMNS